MNELRDLIETRISKQIEDLLQSMTSDNEIEEMFLYFRRTTGIEYNREDIKKLTKSYIKQLGV